MPSGASSFMCPRRIFSSFGNGGKKSGGGGWPGARSGMLGGAEVNADRLCAYARSSGYGIAAAGTQTEKDTGRQRVRVRFEPDLEREAEKSCLPRPSDTNRALLFSVLPMTAQFLESREQREARLEKETVRDPRTPSTTSNKYGPEQSGRNVNRGSFLRCMELGESESEYSSWVGHAVSDQGSSLWPQSSCQE